MTRHQIEDDILLEIKNDMLLNETEFSRDEFPNLYNLSSAFIFGHLPIPKEKKRPEFVFLKDYYQNQKRRAEKEVTIAEWNMIWEVGHLRTDFFWGKLPTELEWLKDYEGENIYLIPDQKDFPYQTYAPLFHLLPKTTRNKFSLPLIKKGNWPFTVDFDSHLIGDLFKNNFLTQFSNAFAYHIWPLLDRQNKLNAFSENDSITLLAHNLKYWLPSMYSVIEDAVQEFGRVEPQSKDQLKKIKTIQKQYPEIDVKLPLMGGHVWLGEDEAWEFTKRLVDKADENGQLRNIIDTIKSNRVHDDFSDKWSYAKEDFERKLYSKRNKVKVNFIEIDETTPIHSQTSEIDNNLLWDDMLSLVDKKERRVVVCLKKGITNHKEISEILGYKNHSPVTKTIKKIRDKAIKELDIKPTKNNR